MDGDFAPTGTIAVAGAELAFRETGAGVPVVLVHGSVSDMRTWRATARTLRGAFRTIAYSRRYAVPNAPIAPEADDPLAQHAEDLAAVITARTSEPVHLVGHSLGGFIALLAALDHPERIRSLVLIEPPVIPLYLDIPPTLPAIIALLRRDRRAALTVLRFAATTMVPARKAFARGKDRAAVRALGRGVLGAKHFAALSPERYEMVWQNRAPDRAQLLGAGYPPLDEDRLRGFSLPVLLVRGEESPKVFHLLTDRLAALLPEARVATVPGASHIVQEDAPEAFVAVLRSFLPEH